MKKTWVVLVMLALAGCASSGGRTPEQLQAIAKVHTELAASYYQRGQYAVALQEIEAALQAEPEYAPAFNVRGLVRMSLREDKQAEADFLQSLKIDAHDSDALNNYGWFLCQRGREREAIAKFTEAIKNPLYATPETSYVNAGLCSKRMGELRAADDYLQRALILRPNLPDALIALADLNFSLGDYAGAKAYFLRFLQSSPELTAANLWLAVRIERKLGDRNSEESYALQLRKRYPDSREAQLLSSGG